MDREVAWGMATVVGIAIGSATYAALVPDPMFATIVAVFWTLGLGLTMQYLVQYTGASREWRIARWSGAAGGLVTLAATLGLSPTLPITPDLRLALGIFVLGLWVTALNVGLALGLEHTKRPGEGVAVATES